MKTPTLEEVKEYFKDALEIKCIADKLPYDITNLKLVQNNELGDKFYSFDDENDIENYCVCFTKEKGYAKILTRKENEYKITKETIIKYQMKDEFPECFKKELIVGKWYKNSIDSLLYCKNIEYDGCISGYGFNQFGQWVDDYVIIPEYTEATPKEVEEALIKEAKKRGFVDGIYLEKSGINKSLSSCVKNPINGNFNYFEHCNVLDSQNGNGHIFDNGTWATILPSKKKMTISEIEEKLGFEIEIV